MEEAMNMVIMKRYFIREGPKLQLRSKNKLCAIKVFKNGFQRNLLPQRAPSWMLQAFWIRF